MKYLLTTLSISLLLSSSLLHADPQPQPSAKVRIAKVGAGIVATAALSYTLWKLYQDMIDPHRLKSR